jgi:hypothetical protein
MNRVPVFDHRFFGRYHESHCVYLGLAGARDGHRGRDGCLRRQEAGSAGLRGAELLTFRSARILVGATVFMIGVLTGAGIAALMMPPV